MGNQVEYLPDLDIESFLTLAKDTFDSLTYDSVKHRVQCVLGNEVVAYLRIPPEISVSNDLSTLCEGITVLYFSVESDKAVISVYEEGENIFHTTFSAYMTRRKQGYSQIKHLNKKGKSKAGSRVRLASTVSFFENINECLTEQFEEHAVERICVSISKSLLPYVYNSKVECPFVKTDERLYKIPLHIQESTFFCLEKVVDKLKVPALFYDDTAHDRIIKMVYDMEG